MKPTILRNPWCQKSLSASYATWVRPERQAREQRCLSKLQTACSSQTAHSLHSVQSVAAIGVASAAINKILRAKGWRGLDLHLDPYFKVERKAATHLAQQRVQQRCASKLLLCHIYAVRWGPAANRLFDSLFMYSCTPFLMQCGGPSAEGRLPGILCRRLCKICASSVVPEDPQEPHTEVRQGDMQNEAHLAGIQQGGPDCRPPSFLCRSLLQTAWFGTGRGAEVASFSFIT